MDHHGENKKSGNMPDTIKLQFMGGPLDGHREFYERKLIPHIYIYSLEEQDTLHIYVHTLHPTVPFVHQFVYEGVDNDHGELVEI